MEKAKHGDKVKVHYHGKLPSGDTFDSSKDRDPLEFEIGSGSVIKGFDSGVAGMSIGEKKTINITYNEAYGPRKSEMMFEMPKEKFPKDIEVKVGLQLMMSDGDGHKFPVTVTQLKGEMVILDANHPLAGQDLIFDIELVEIINKGTKIIIE